MQPIQLKHKYSTSERAYIYSICTGHWAETPVGAVSYSLDTNKYTVHALDSDNQLAIGRETFAKLSAAEFYMVGLAYQLVARLDDAQ